MAWVLIGLGNTGEQYRGTRHNAGRDFVRAVAEAHGFPAFKQRASAQALVSMGEIAGHKVTLVVPETLMNLSGKAALSFVKSVRAAKQLLVVRDDLDLPMGTIKMTTHGRGSGGHKGVDSIAHAIKTKDFLQLKIGVSPITSKGAVRKPKAGEAVVSFVLGSYTAAERKALESSFERAREVVETLVAVDPPTAIKQANTRVKE